MATNEKYPDEGDVLRTVYVPQSLDERLKGLAHEEGTSVSRLIRRAAQMVPAMCAADNPPMP
jgi:hypothetical protein